MEGGYNGPLTDADGAAELAKARTLDEGFEVQERPEDEPVEDETIDAADVTVEQWKNAQELIKKFSKENIEMRALLTRYRNTYGELED